MIGCKLKTFLVWAAFASALAVPAPAISAERAFVKVEVADADAIEDWYVRAFDLKRGNLFSRPAFDQRILLGEDLVLELVQSRPAATPVNGKRLGIGKVGLQVADFDRKLAAWRASGIAEGRGLFFDEALGLATISLRDPEGNIVQIFGKSAGPFDARIKVSPDFTAVQSQDRR